jgi:glycosyltransferase involved in cell wall biosynthesis
LADKIDKILPDEERTQMGEEAYHVIKEKINLDTVARRYMDAFEYVMKK